MQDRVRIFHFLIMEVRDECHSIHNTNSHCILLNSLQRNEKRLQGSRQQMYSCVAELEVCKTNTQLFFCWNSLGNRWNNNCTLVDFIILVNIVIIVSLAWESLPFFSLCDFKWIQFCWVFQSSYKPICCLLVVPYPI